MSDVDGRVELDLWLASRAASDAVAANAPASTKLYAYLEKGLHGPDANEFEAFVTAAVLELGAWWSPGTFRRMPALTPWCVRDRSCRWDQGPESWGAPREDGYFRDDNSIIKKLPLPLMIDAPGGHPYAGRKPWRGFTACHVWRDLPEGAVGGEDPFVYSFVPNLAWLPSPLSPLSDRHESFTQRLLQAIAVSLYRDLEPAAAVAPWATHGWNQLQPQPHAYAIDAGDVATFTTDTKFFRRRIAYLVKVAAACETALEGGQLPYRVISSRFAARLPDVAPRELKAFRDTLLAYAAAVGHALDELECTPALSTSGRGYQGPAD